MLPKINTQIRFEIVSAKTKTSRAVPSCVTDKPFESFRGVQGFDFQQKHPTLLCKNNKGISLLEVMIAVALLAMMAASLTFGLNQTNDRAQLVRMHVTANEFLRSTAELVATLPYRTDDPNLTGHLLRIRDPGEEPATVDAALEIDDVYSPARLESFLRANPGDSHVRVPVSFLADSTLGSQGVLEIEVSPMSDPVPFSNTGASRVPASLRLCRLTLSYRIGSRDFEKTLEVFRAATN